MGTCVLERFLPAKVLNASCECISCCTKAGWLPAGQEAMDNGTLHHAVGAMGVCAVVRGPILLPMLRGYPLGHHWLRRAMQGPPKSAFVAVVNTEQVLCGGVTYRKAVARSTAELYQVRQPQYCAATPCSCPACRCSPCRKLCRAPAPFQSSATQGQPLAKPASCFRLCSRKEKDLSFLPALRCLLLNFTLLCRTSVSPVLCQMV